MIVTALSIFLALMGLSVPVAAALGLSASLLGQLYAFLPVHGVLGEIAWGASHDYIMIALPMFIFMGELMLRAGLSESLFAGLRPWFDRIPGRLMHTNIFTGAIFAATSGSSVATAATVGTVAIPNMEKGRYNQPLFLGSIAAGGTLGILIPPSTNMIIYAVLTDTSIAKLYAGGLVSGVVLTLLFSLTVYIACVLRPGLDGVADSGALLPLRKKLSGLRHVVPPLVLFMIVVGSIYIGVATATEAAVLGAAAMLLLCAWRRTLTLPVVLQALEGTIRTTCMVMLIVIAAFFLNFVMVSTGLITAITDYVIQLEWSPLATVLAIIVFYLVLGCFMETLSMMIATTPIVAPVIVALGYDPIWWGIVFVILTEAALITPPVGLNLFVVQSLRRDGRLSDLYIGASPFVISMLVMIGLLIAFPQIALWLPSLLNPSQ